MHSQNRSNHLEALLRSAMARRAPLARDPATTLYRLVHGAADSLAGFTVDRCADVLVVNVYPVKPGPGEPACVLAEFVETLAAVAQPRAIYVKRRPPEAARLTPAQIAALAPAEPAWGAAAPEVAGREAGLTYLIRPGAGLSTGLFLDMREVRGRVRSWAAGRVVLNAFSYTCAFGVAALVGGAARVLNLDLSRTALAWGQDNYRANGLTPQPHDFVYGDVFDWLRRLPRLGQMFDLVILDPPGFSRAKGRTFQAARDYGELVARAARVLAAQGRLLACCNLADWPLDAFRRQVLAGLTAAGRPGRVIGVYHEPNVDFPAAPGQKPYLKVLAIDV